MSSKVEVSAANILFLPVARGPPARMGARSRETPNPPRLRSEAAGDGFLWVVLCWCVDGSANWEFGAALPLAMFGRHRLESARLTAATRGVISAVTECMLLWTVAVSFSKCHPLSLLHVHDSELSLSYTSHVMSTCQRATYGLPMHVWLCARCRRTRSRSQIAMHIWYSTRRTPREARRPRT